MKLSRILDNLRSIDWRGEWFHFRRAVAILFARSCRFKRVGHVVDVCINGKSEVVARRMDQSGWFLRSQAPAGPEIAPLALAAAEALELRYLAARSAGLVR